MRLQKFMSMCGVASRRKSEEMILQGLVRVNGEIVQELGTKIDPVYDLVSVNGRVLRLEHTVTLALFKPVGVMCTNNDPEGRLTIQAFVKDVPVRLYHIGRLDYDTEGLILMSNDGELANMLMHPRHEIEKTYLVTCQGILSANSVKQLREGIQLEDGMTAPAQVTIIKKNHDQTVFRITIHEGRNRQVRRMLTAVGHDIRQLRREKVGNITLEGLQSGNWRVLTDLELETLRGLAVGIE